MNYEKALEHIEMCLNECDDCLICKELDEALEVAKVAIERNIPKQPTKFKYIGDKLVGVYCPTCGLELTTTARPCYCGQRISPYYWSEN